MTELFKKKYGLYVALVFLWGFQFLFSPFLHYHPSNTHGHSGELSPHKHEGHLHAHEVESITHVINLHPSDPALDEIYHHSHSSPEHDSDYIEVSINDSSIKSEPLFNFFKDGEKLTSFNIPQRTFSFPILSKTIPPKDPGPFEIPKERSPPVLPV